MKYRISVDFSKKRKDGLAPVFLNFEHCGKRFKVSTGIFAANKPENRVFPKAEPNAKVKTSVLARALVLVDDYLIAHADESFDTTKQSILSLLGKSEPRKTKTLCSYIEDFAATKQREGTRALYLLTARKVADYDPKATFSSVTKDWLDRWTRFNAHMSVNGFAIHLRNLRTVFNWAIDNEVTDLYPFRRYKIKTEKVAINNISINELRQLRDYPVEPWQEIYRDFFMLTFYLCGVNPVDLLNLRHEDLRSGRIRYRRRKTGHLFDIPVPDEAQKIISKYKGHDYLLSPLDNYTDYKDFLHHWNDALKKIGPSEKVPDKVGKLRKVVYRPIVPGITVYTARYTFASIGADIDIPREIIALCLGHSWADVTSHYISYSTKKIDEAVKKIVDYVNADLVSCDPKTCKPAKIQKKATAYICM